MVCLVPALAVCFCLLLLGLGSLGCAARAQHFLFSLFFGLGQLGFALFLHFVMVSSSVLVLLMWRRSGCLFLMFLGFALPYCRRIRSRAASEFR